MALVILSLRGLTLTIFDKQDSASDSCIFVPEIIYPDEGLCATADEPFCELFILATAAAATIHEDVFGKIDSDVRLELVVSFALDVKLVP